MKINLCFEAHGQATLITLDASRYPRNAARVAACDAIARAQDTLQRRTRRPVKLRDLRVFSAYVSPYISQGGNTVTLSTGSEI